MKLFKLMTLLVSTGIFLPLAYASAPAPQTMNDVLVAAIIKERNDLKTENALLQSKVHQYEKIGCCDKLDTKCNSMGARADAMCQSLIVDQYNAATCKSGHNCTSYGCRDSSHPCNGTAKLIVGATCCLPVNLARVLLCGTTYICCDANCSSECLK